MIKKGKGDCNKTTESSLKNISPRFGEEKINPQKKYEMLLILSQH